MSMKMGPRNGAAPVFRVIAIALLVLGLLQFADLASKDTSGQTLVRLALYVGALACVPVVYKAWPSPHVKITSVTKLSVIYLIFFLLLVMETFSEPLRHSAFDNYPRLKESVHIAGGSLPLLFLLAVLGALMVALGKWKPIVQQTRTGSWITRLGLWVAVVIVACFLPSLLSPRHTYTTAIVSYAFSARGSWIRPVVLVSAGVVLTLFARGFFKKENTEE